MRGWNGYISLCFSSRGAASAADGGGGFDLLFAPALAAALPFPPLPHSSCDFSPLLAVADPAGSGSVQSSHPVRFTKGDADASGGGSQTVEVPDCKVGSTERPEISMPVYGPRTKGCSDRVSVESYHLKVLIKFNHKFNCRTLNYLTK